MFTVSELRETATMIRFAHGEKSTKLLIGKNSVKNLVETSSWYNFEVMVC